MQEISDSDFFAVFLKRFCRQSSRIAGAQLTFCQKEFRDITGNNPCKIAREIYERESGSYYDPQQFVRDAEPVAEAPQLEKFDGECENCYDRRDYEPVPDLIGDDRPNECIQKDDDEDVTEIAPYPAVCKKADEDLDAKKQGR